MFLFSYLEDLYGRPLTFSNSSLDGIQKIKMQYTKSIMISN